ncbi:MAG: hypothetical protein CLLPBCKN_005782 [Chroococcidiopsis cubana SAG 39.79]|uniref:DUF4197 domain-containing protein n=1 Tax=Chroococcidiopsis cubana SAG 39.79 TaxID=388085 RepID=A0AB37UML2_9CYAN|nr:hypothetical protein [Chroococcidiopsis cubana]MDZ4876362.1 hypothetical protein [Chroococcidiopsis cubana SAG 39.79]PSB64996.1 hypothetical protein C7B79_07345 [Chroococcidiopsis cubana CCALA 043]RUT12646.1 hypothetical protein DSM107010_20270 [Chroococcidiopsis cubana SAG 39.79]
MNVQRQLCISLALGSFLLVGSLPALAQKNNQSDVTDFIITTGDIVSGAFVPGRNGGFNPAAQVAIDRAAAALNGLLAKGAIAGIPQETQQALASILTETGNPTLAVTQFQNTLVAAGADSKLAAGFVKSLQGLTAGNVISPGKLVGAIEAYNALVNSGNGNFLQVAAPQLQAVKAALLQLAEALTKANSPKANARP